MKKYLFLSMAILALTFTNCKKDEDTDETSAGSTYLKMKIDNANEQTFDADVTVAGGQINISGTNGANTLNIVFSSDASGNLDDNQYGITYSEGQESIFNSVIAYDSELNITKNDTSGKIVAGEFSVEYYDDAQNLHTAEGSFDLEY